MKTFLSTLIAVILFLNSAAQSLNSRVKYIWKNGATNITAAIEISGLQHTNKSVCIFYLKSVDTVYNKFSDSLFNKFVGTYLLNYPIVKISFFNISDTVIGKKIKLYGEEFSKFILADVQKKYPQIKTNNLVVAGVDNFALAALFAATNNPLKINKTALFFNNVENTSLLRYVNMADAKKLKGKLYLYVNHQNNQDTFADSMAKDLVLNSVVVLYKFDFFGNNESSKVFEEAYNWLFAEGNNYIIRDDD